MVLFIILGVVVLVTFVVLGVLFSLLSKEEQKEKVVPVTDLGQLKKDLSSQVFEQKDLKVSLPTQDAQTFLEDEKGKKRSQELEDKLLAISKENESLKSQQANLEQAQQKLTELQGEASSLKTENASLQAQLESTNAKARLLEEEISRANAMVSELNREKEALLSAPKSGPDEALRHELESLKYELIKARAQSSGLERVSFNYKNQLEDFFKKVNAVQVNNDHLSQVKNRLEGMVQEIKVQNEELVKKDRLAQFELEKNRSRLLSLEREYEDFKARTQQQNQ